MPEQFPDQTPQDTPSPSKEELAGARLLHANNSALQLSDPVEYEQARREKAEGLETNTNPALRISNWLEVLQRTHQARGASPELQEAHSRVLERIKASYHKLFVIKPDEVPDYAFVAEVRQAREMGHGNITPDEEFKQAKINEIIAAQEASLDRWVDYLTSGDADAAGYPMWARYWAFMAITTMGKIKKEEKEGSPPIVKFATRDVTTIASYPILNPMALAQTIAAMSHRLEQEGLPKGGRTISNTSTILTDEKYNALLSNKNFATIYAQFLSETPSMSRERLKETRGEWVCYKQGSDAQTLYDSLHNHVLEWCTAGAISTAQGQLDGGDFYVYYSLDETGEANIPRIAIRMEQGEIAEIRGIEHGQHLDSYIDPVLSTKLEDSEEFPNAEEYKQAIKDMKLVSEIEVKLGAQYDDMTAEFLSYSNLDYKLSPEELRFIYEIDDKILSLGYGRDLRIEQILDYRNDKADLSLILDIDEAKISITTEGALSGGILYHHGNLDLNTLTSAKGLTLPNSIGGGLNLDSLTSAEGLTLPNSTGDSLDLNSLTSAEGLTLPNFIGGSLDLDSLTSAEGLTLPNSIGGGLYLRSLTSAEGLTLPNSIVGDLYLNSLTSVEGLTLPNSIGGGLYLGGLTSVEGLTLPNSIGGGLYLGSLTSAEGLTLPNSIVGDLFLNSLTSAEGLTLPNIIGGDLFLRSLTSAEGLTLPNSIGGDLYLSSLTSAEGLTLPNSIGGDLYLRGLTSAEGLTLPNSIGGDLDLGGLTSAEGLALPNFIGDSLDLGSLTSADKNKLRMLYPLLASKIT